MEKSFDLQNLIELRSKFSEALELLSVYGSVMNWAKDPEVRELGEIYNRGFKILRDEFQTALQEKINQ